MKTEIKDSPICILVEDQYIFYYPENFFEIDKNKSLKTRTSKDNGSVRSYFLFKDITYQGIYVDDNGCLCYVIPFCKHYNSRNIIRKDFNSRELYLSNGNILNVKMKRYLCKDCLSKSQTELIGLYEPYARFSTPVINLANQALSNGYKSLRQHANDIKLYSGISISHETIRKSLLIDGDFYYRNNFVELSGYYSYDAQ